MTDTTIRPGYAYKWKDAPDHIYWRQPFVAIGPAWQNPQCWVFEKVNGAKVEFHCYHIPCSKLERWTEKDVERLTRAASISEVA